MIDKTPSSRKPAPPKRRARGFEQSGNFVERRVRKAAERRGFVEMRVLTHWAEIAGKATAAICRPVKVGYGREGFGATLTLLTSGAHAPMLEAELPKIRERVNAAYGYAAISRIRLTQTAAAGFAEDRAAFDPAPREDKPLAVLDPNTAGEVNRVTDPRLRTALERLGRNILSRRAKPLGKGPQ